jgi:hypothetical protein
MKVWLFPEMNPYYAALDCPTPERQFRARSPPARQLLENKSRHVDTSALVSAAGAIGLSEISGRTKLTCWNCRSRKHRGCPSSSQIHPCLPVPCVRSRAAFTSARPAGYGFGYRHGTAFGTQGRRRRSEYLTRKSVHSKRSSRSGARVARNSSSLPNALAANVNVCIAHQH